MAESMDKFLKASSDILPELFCETCEHNIPKKPQIKLQDSANEKCHTNKGEIIGSFCRSCDQLCCEICIVVNHRGCTVDSISNISENITSSQEFKDLNKKLNLLQKGYNENLQEAEKHVTHAEKTYKEAIKDIKKLKYEFDKLLAETEKQAADTKKEDLKKIKTVSTTSSILLKEINKIAMNLELVEAKKDNDNLFIMMKRAESQMQSLEESLVKLETDTKIRNYKFKPEEKIVALMKDLKVLGQLAIPNVTSSVKMLKTPTHHKDIDIKTNNIRGSVMITNHQLLVADWYGRVKLIDAKSATIVSELHLPENLWDLTKVKSTEVAITCPNAKKIQFVSLSANTLSKVREMSVNGDCRGIAYNNEDQTLVVTLYIPSKVEILNMAGSVIRSFDKDASGALLFSEPWYIALSPDQTLMYISDYEQDSVTVMTMQGEVKAVYEDEKLELLSGICVNRLGIVYVVGYKSNTVHQMLPGSDKLEPILDQNDGLTEPFTITYCDEENKLYVGQYINHMLKVFQMK